jgi:hypothetical protein
MSVEFSNAYQEILLDNLIGIIKQNFIFQTQIKLLESSSKDKESLQKSFNELKIKYDELNDLFNSKQGDLKQSEIYKSKFEEVKFKYDELNNLYNSKLQDLKNIDVYKSKAEQNSIIQQEKNRIQSALNDEMKKTATFKKDLENSTTEIKKLKDYISKLEEIAPVTKLKKIKISENQKTELLQTDPAKSEIPKVENKIQPKVLVSNTF